MKQRFLGAWELVSFVATKPDGSISSPLGREPVGSIVYAPNWMSVHMMRKNRVHPQPGANFSLLADDVVGPLARSYTAYAGTWTFDEEEMIVRHQVEQALDPDLIPGPQVRHVRFIGDDQLELTAPVGNGVSLHSTLLWKRLVR